MTGPRHISIPKILDGRGHISFLEPFEIVPFKIQRAYWIYDVPGGQCRGGHAFRSTQEVLIALSGSFDVVLNDGATESIHSLNRSYNGLYVPQMMWRMLRNFSTNATALILASTGYSESDYVRDFEEFRRLRKAEFEFDNL